MNFKIKEENDESIISIKNIYAAGVKVGVIEEKNNYGKFCYHVCMDINITGFAAGLVQGHGSTPEESIKNAFISSRKNAEKYIDGIEKLKTLFA